VRQVRTGSGTNLNSSQLLAGSDIWVCTNQVGVIGRRRDADSFRGAPEHVAHVVGKVLYHVGDILHALWKLPPSEDLIVHHNVVRRL